MVSGKFFLLALLSLFLYSCYINFVFVNLDQEMYPVYLYDPQDKLPVNREYVTKLDSREALEAACKDQYSVGTQMHLFCLFILTNLVLILSIHLFLNRCSSGL